MKFIKRALIVAIVCAGLAGAVYFVGIPVGAAAFMPDEIKLSRAEIENRTAVKPHNFVSGVYEDAVFTADETRTFIDFKLFGLIPIKRVIVDVMPYDRLYAGGVPVGFVAKTDGVVVLQDAKGYKRGDVITRIDGATVTGVGDLQRHMKGRQIGTFVKDDTTGVGTLTYVNPQNNNFAALGHKIVDFETGAMVNLRSGDVYACNVIGVEKSTKATVGTIESTLKKGTGGVQGSVLSSNNNGVFGCLHADSKIAEMCTKLYPVASRYSVKLGKATILSCLDGENIVEYDIVIQRAKYQRDKNGKGLIIKITDPRLIEKTGGIVHGMSGSPIIQNGHIVGAVTHVMTGDVTRGYGIYVDFLVP